MGLDMPKTLEDFNKCLQANNKVAVDFTASWCGPCKRIGPIFEALESNYPNIKFIKVDVDENDQAAANCEISAMPTFQFFLDGKKTDDLVGANEEALKQKLAALNSK